MRLGNRIYRIWVKLELPKYFLNLHTDCATKRATWVIITNLMPVRVTCPLLIFPKL